MARKTMKKAKLGVSFDTARRGVLSDPKAAAVYLEECLADGNIDLFKEALKHVADARVGGVGQLAELTDLNRETLYRTLSKRGNPSLDTLTAILGACGLRVAVTAQCE